MSTGGWPTNPWCMPSVAALSLGFQQIFHGSQIGFILSVHLSGDERLGYFEESACLYFHGHADLCAVVHGVKAHAHLARHRP